MGVIVKKASIGPNIINDGLMFYLDAANNKSYPGTGTIWYDLMNTKDGTITNGAQYDNTNIETFTFDGTDGKIVIDNTRPFNEVDNLYTDSSTKYTANVWFKTTNTGSITLLGKSGGWGGSATFVMGVTNANSIRSVIRGSSTTTSSVLNVGSWNMSSYTWDGTTLKCYVNGEFVQNMNVGTVGDQNYTLYIGAAGSSGTTYMFNGSIANVSLYNKDLTSLEIKKLFNALKNRFNI